MRAEAVGPRKPPLPSLTGFPSLSEGLRAGRDLGRQRAEGPHLTLRDQLHVNEWQSWALRPAPPQQICVITCLKCTVKDLIRMNQAFLSKPS